MLHLLTPLQKKKNSLCSHSSAGTHPAMEYYLLILSAICSGNLCFTVYVNALSQRQWGSLG